ncbi:MAG: homocysteine S-methyltransferase family protein, partial [Proteobacteria bacterium]|nr:homocysteine S-methyltransferase family protein [Pseudomonadota bacterium]
AAAGTGLPFLVSFVCDASGRLPSGESLADALAEVAAFDPVAVGVNCLPPPAVSACLPALAGSGLPFGVYANLGAPSEDGGFARSDDCSPHDFARFATSWIEAGARFAGGCCGTDPSHIRALADALS